MGTASGQMLPDESPPPLPSPRAMIRQALLAAVVIGLTTALVALLPAHVIFGTRPYLKLFGLLAAAGVTADARRLRLWDYATGFGRRPWILFLLAALWWIVVVPWYLTVRERVVRGEVPRRSA